MAKNRTNFWNICLLFIPFYDILLDKAKNIAKTLISDGGIIVWDIEKFPRNKVKY